MSKMGKPGLCLPQSHPAGTWQSQDSNAQAAVPKSLRSYVRNTDKKDHPHPTPQREVTSPLLLPTSALDLLNCSHCLLTLSAFGWPFLAASADRELVTRLRSVTCSPWVLSEPCHLLTGLQFLIVTRDSDITNLPFMNDLPSPLPFFLIHCFLFLRLSTSLLNVC